MTESQGPSPTGPPTGRPPGTPAGAAGGRYTRSSGGLVGAMIVTVLAVLAFAAFRAVTRDNEPTPVRSVDYAASAKAARGEGKLLVLVPDRLPVGWKATSATYTRGTAPTWHLGVLTAKGKYVGVEEARVSIKELATEHVDADAERGKDVTIDGQAWQTWTDAGGDYAVARTLEAGEDAAESVLVVGTAPEGEVRDFAASLQGGTLPAAG